MHAEPELARPARSFVAQRIERLEALVDGPLRQTWSAWGGAVGAVQRALAELGLRRGDHVRAILQKPAPTLHAFPPIPPA